MRSLCVFCGSSTGNKPVYAAAARALADEMARREIRLVYGGGSNGIMGAVADRIMEAGGSAVGVIPRILLISEHAHQGLTELHTADDLTERKRMMAELSDGFVALPGGLGTLEEISEVMSWGQLDLHRKPYGFLSTDGYYDRLIDFLDHGVSNGFIAPPARELINVSHDPVALLDTLWGDQGS